jgi:hypothetical protein
MKTTKPRFKTVTITLPAEEFEKMDASIRRQYAGMYFNGNPVGIQERAEILLRRDAADLLSRRPSLSARGPETRATAARAQILPFWPLLTNRESTSPAVS